MTDAADEDDDWTRVLAGVQAVLAGDRDGGRAAMLAEWAALGNRPSPPQRCVLAHYLADLEPAVADEVVWDERALAAYASVGPHDLVAVGIPDSAGMAASLHLNLGDGYLRLGRVADASEQVAAGLAACGALPDDGYGALVRRGLDRLADRVALAER